MVKLIISGIVLTALVSPAIATEYWVEYNYSTHECSIVEKKSPDSATDATKDGPMANPTADRSASDTSNDRPASDVPMGFAAPTKDMPPVVVESGAPSDTPSITPGAPAPVTTTTAVSPTGTPNGATTPGAPTDTSNGEDKEDKKDPFAPLAAAWAQKKAAAEANGTADVQTILVGIAKHSREEAESEMQIMRICGLAN